MAVEIILVGCGGVGTMFADLIATSFKRKRMVYVDGDAFTKDNLLRQTFLVSDIGRNKAEAMADRYKNGTAHTQFITDVSILPDAKIIVCAVDNNAARRACMAIARSQRIPCIIAANETESSMVYVYYPHIGDDKNPMKWYPELATDTVNTVTTNCATAIETKGREQTKVANVAAAVMAINALIATENAIRYKIPYEMRYIHWYACNGNIKTSRGSDLPSLFPHVFQEATHEVA